MDIQQVVRQHFRISIKGNEHDINVWIKGKDFRLVDVGSRGIGIRIASEDILLTVEEELDMELDIAGKKLKIKGRIVHISPDGEENSLCGIEFLDLDRDEEKMLLNFLKHGRSELFSG